MSEKLPIIEELEQADTFSKMAEWLRACPLAIFASHGDQIEAIVCGRGFMEAGEYVNIYMAALHKGRMGEFIPDPNGPYYATNPYTQGLLNRAFKLDECALLFSAFDLAWHATHKPQEATDAG